VYDLVCERGLMTREALDQLLNPEAMTKPMTKATTNATTH
jgi:aspartate ammonia-lyase